MNEDEDEFINVGPEMYFNSTNMPPMLKEMVEQWFGAKGETEVNKVVDKKRSPEFWREKAYKMATEENETSPRGIIHQTDIDYLKKVLEAPVEQFIALV